MSAHLARVKILVLAGRKLRGDGVLKGMEIWSPSILVVVADPGSSVVIDNES